MTEKSVVAPVPLSLPLSSQIEQPPPDFYVSTILFITAHGNLSSKIGKVIDVTSAIPNPHTLSPDYLVQTARELVKRQSPGTGYPERYHFRRTRIDKYDVVATSTSTHSQAVPAPAEAAAAAGEMLIAKFKAHLIFWHSLTINMYPTPTSAAAPHHQSQIPLQMVHFITRTHRFLYQDVVYTWLFMSGSEINLLRGEFFAHGKNKIKKKKKNMTNNENNHNLNHNHTANGVIPLAKFFFHSPTYFQSSGVLALSEEVRRMGGGGGGGGQRNEFEDLIVATLAGVLRREREWRYALASNIWPLKRSCV